MILFLIIFLKKLSSGTAEKMLSPVVEENKLVVKSIPSSSLAVVSQKIKSTSKIPINQRINEVNNLFSNKQGVYGWYVQPLLGGTGYGSNFDFAYTAASINKIPIMITFIKNIENGNFNLNNDYSLSSNDIEEGSGTLQYQKLGSVWTYQQLIEFSGHYSDNTAINAMHRIVGFGQPQKLIDDYEMPFTDINQNTSSPKDMASLFAAIYSHQIIKDDNLLSVFYKSLQNTEYEEDLIPEGVPKNIPVSHKIGWQIQVWNDCGIVFSSRPYILCIMNDKIAESEAREVVPQISRKIWTYEGDQL